jgi:chlorite dismutase
LRRTIFHHPQQHTKEVRDELLRRLAEFDSERKSTKRKVSSLQIFSQIADYALLSISTQGRAGKAAAQAIITTAPSTRRIQNKSASTAASTSSVETNAQEKSPELADHHPTQFSFARVFCPEVFARIVLTDESERSTMHTIFAVVW